MKILEVKNLKKQYKETQALKGINFSVEKGDVLGLLGPNGAGKSTTISIISTLISDYSGEVLFKGKVVDKTHNAFLNKIGVVPQEIALYPTLSGLENLKFFGRAYGVTGKKLKRRIDEISKVIGIDQRLKDKIETYSGGMKRRLNIGVALLHKPELLIMDEPTVGIDPQSRKHILDTVLELNKEGMTIIYTSHYMEEVEYLCNYINILDKGEIIASGTKEELISQIDHRNIVKISFRNLSEALVSQLDHLINNGKIVSFENMLEIETQRPERVMKEVFDFIATSDEEIDSVDIQKPNLEALFLHLTGKALRD